MRKKREEKLEEIAIQIQIKENELDDKYKDVLSTKVDNQKLEIDFLKRKVKVEEEHNGILNGNVLGMKMKEKHIILNRQIIMKTFKQFVCSTTGVNEDNASEIIDQLLSYGQ